MITTTVRIRQVDEPSLASHPLPRELAAPDRHEWEWSYYLPNVPVKFTPHTQTGVLSIYPFGQVWCLSPGNHVYIPAPPPVYMSELLKFLRSVREGAMDPAEAMELRDDLCEVLKAIHLNLAVIHPTHFPEWWAVKPRKRKASKK